MDRDRDEATPKDDQSLDDVKELLDQFEDATAAKGLTDEEVERRIREANERDR